MTAVTITLQAKVTMSVLLMRPHTAQSVNKRQKAGVTTRCDGDENIVFDAVFWLQAAGKCCAGQP